MPVCIPYMTTKTRRRSAYSFTRKRTINYDGSITNSDTISNNVLWADTIDGGYLPDWKARIRKNLNATTPLTVNARKITGEGARSYVKSKEFTDGSSGRYAHSFLNQTAIVFADSTLFGKCNLLSNTYINRADQAALGRYYQKAREVQVSFQGGVGLGELREALHQIRHPALTLRRKLSGLLFAYKSRTRPIRRRVGSLRGRVNELNGTLRDTWLEWSFGAQPTLHDIDDACRTIARLQYESRLDAYKYVVGEAHEEDGDVTSSVWAPGGWSLHANVTHTAHKIVSSKFYGPVRCAPWGGVPMSSSLMGFDLSNWAPTIYELIPYSWLADYFSNLGQVVNAFTFCRSGIKWMSNTIYEQGTFQSVIVGHDTTSPQLVVDSSFSGNRGAEVTRITRRPLTAFPLPELYFTIPGFGTRWANMAAVFYPFRSFQRTLGRFA